MNISTMMLNTHIIIPARLNSSRLPRKLMLKLDGEPIIAHTIRTALQVTDSVVVATDDLCIFDCALSHGAKAIMTSVEHQSGTDRIAEAAKVLGLPKDDIVINLQGDEPFLPPSLINQVSTLLEESSSAGIATLMQSIDNTNDFLSPNVVKVAIGEDNKALYFSRSPIPYPRDCSLAPNTSLTMKHVFRHIGLYAYRVSVLEKITSLQEHPLEALEKLEQLRALAHGIEIVCQLATTTPPHGVDTAEDLERLRKLFIKEV